MNFYVINRGGDYLIVMKEEIRLTDRVVFGPSSYGDCQRIKSEYSYDLWYGEF